MNLGGRQGAAYLPDLGYPFAELMRHNGAVRNAGPEARGRKVAQLDQCPLWVKADIWTCRSQRLLSAHPSHPQDPGRYPSADIRPPPPPLMSDFDPLRTFSGLAPSDCLWPKAEWRFVAFDTAKRPFIEQVAEQSKTAANRNRTGMKPSIRSVP